MLDSTKDICDDLKNTYDPTNAFDGDYTPRCSRVGYTCRQSENSHSGHDVTCPLSAYYDPNDHITKPANTWTKHNANKKVRNKKKAHK